MSRDSCERCPELTYPLPDQLTRELAGGWPPDVRPVARWGTPRLRRPQQSPPGARPGQLVVSIMRRPAMPAVGNHMITEAFRGPIVPPSSHAQWMACGAWRHSRGAEPGHLGGLDGGHEDGRLGWCRNVKNPAVAQPSKRIGAKPATRHCLDC